MRVQEPDISDSTSEVDDTFATALDFDKIVDPANWRPPGEYYQTMPSAVRAAVSAVVESDERLRQELRNESLPALLKAGTIQCWGKAVPQYIETLQRKRLYTGQVFA